MPIRVRGLVWPSARSHVAEPPFIAHSAFLCTMGPVLRPLPYHPRRVSRPCGRVALATGPSNHREFHLS